ncbi:hypothetical protein H6P81_010646 [Aristolochia fimbriata]|uniref:Protein POLYCHOME-like n=1 Tax=Aristolochia fimbriata TaxID=158543 RepID=A0AAV7EQH3_ARIFI|nr:hypothetical protein H6P81_010646 [Aristolochia fimbriata]
MPEARDRLPGRGIQDSPSDFGIRRGYYAVGRSRNGSGVHRSVSENKENIPPESSRSRRRRRRPKKSRLPSWYPRTPLRDITAIVAAMERRRVRLRNEAEMRRRNQEALDSPRTPVRGGSPSAPEPSVSEDTRRAIEAAQEPSVSEETPRPVQATACNSAEILEHSTPAESSPQSIRDAANDAPVAPIMPTNDQSLISVQKKLSEMQELEKAVKNRLKERKKTQKQPNTQYRRNTLMSMR